MVRSLLSAVGVEVRGMHQAAYLLALFALLSQLLALVRDRLLAASFGASHTLDVYYAAFRVPDLLFATVASLLSLYALLPVLSRVEAKGGGLASFIEHMLLYFFAAMAAVCGAAFVFAPELLRVLVPGVAGGADGASLVLLTRILLLQPVLLGASNILANLTQLRHRFLIYSISPLLYNFGIIGGIVFLYPRMGLSGLAWGVVLGALMHLLIQVPNFLGERDKIRATFKESFKALIEVLKLSVPRTLSLSANQLSLAVLVALASFLAPGSIAVFTFAWNLQAVPLTIIGVSYSVAAFPTLSRLLARGEHPEFLKHLETALRHIIFWSIPATVFVVVLRAQLVRAILGSGAFDWAATRLVAAALALLILSLLAQSASLLIARAYYAAGSSLKPFLFGVIDVGVSVASAFALVGAFHASTFWRYFLESLLRVADLPGTTVLMLALALALGSIAEFAAGYWYLCRDFGLRADGIGKLAFESFAASVIGGAVSYGMLSWLGSVININTAPGVMAEGVLAGLAGLCVTALMLALLRNRELLEAYASLRRRVITEPPALEATDVQS